jgi:hypothetical protein
MRCNERSDAIRCDEMRQPQPYLPIRIADLNHSISSEIIRGNQGTPSNSHRPPRPEGLFGQSPPSNYGPCACCERTARRQLMREAIREVIRANEMASHQLLMREAIREVIRANEMAAHQRTHLR